VDGGTLRHTANGSEEVSSSGKKANFIYEDEEPHCHVLVGLGTKDKNPKGTCLRESQDPDSAKKHTDHPVRITGTNTFQTRGTDKSGAGGVRGPYCQNPLGKRARAQGEK